VPVVFGALCPPAAAAELAAVLDVIIPRAMTVDALRLSNEALAFLDDLKTVANAYNQDRAARRASAVDADLHAQRPGTFAPGSLKPMNEVSLSKAAELEGVTRQAIWQRCRRGYLPYRRDDKGRLWVRRENLRGKADG
jgi:hypothetical protein